MSRRRAAAVRVRLLAPTALAIVLLAPAGRGGPIVTTVSVTGT